MLLPPEDRVKMVLDTDTYNEIDDQFAVVHAILSPEKLNLEAMTYSRNYKKRIGTSD